MPRDPKVCRALGKYFFRASVYINNSCHPKSVSQHHSGGWTIVSELLARLPSGTTARPWAAG